MPVRGHRVDPRRSSLHSQGSVEIPQALCDPTQDTGSCAHTTWAQPPLSIGSLWRMCFRELLWVPPCCLSFLIASFTTLLPSSISHIPLFLEHSLFWLHFPLSTFHCCLCPKHHVIRVHTDSPKALRDVCTWKAHLVN